MYKTLNQLPFSLDEMNLARFGPGSFSESAEAENQSAYSRRVYRSMSRSVTDHKSAITDGDPESKIFNGVPRGSVRPPSRSLPELHPIR